MKGFGVHLGKSKGRRTMDRVEGFATCIGEGARFTGKVGGEGNCVVHGHVEGDCDLNGILLIGEKGRWIGNVIAENVLLAGYVEGDVTAKEKIEIVSTAHVKGTITATAMAIAEGAVHEGKVHMISGLDLVKFTDKREED